MRRLEHIGIAVDTVAPVVRTFQKLLGRRPYKAETVSEQQVRTHFIDAYTAKLELLESLDPDSAIGKYVKKRGEGLHHLAFEVDDASATMERLQSEGFTILGESPSSGADDKQIFFVHPKETHGVLVEFCETVNSNWAPRTIAHRDGRLAVYERGDATRPTVLCLHGAGGSTLLDTAPLLRRLESTFHVVGIDLSGHGASDFPPDDRLSFDAFVDDVDTAADAFDLDSCHLFGFSMGSTVALQYAHTYPNRVERLALFAPNIAWDDGLVADLKSHLDMAALEEKDPERAETVRSRQKDVDRLFRAVRAFADRFPEISDSLTPKLKEIQAPSLVAGVDQDPLFPLMSTQNLYERLPNARLSILPGREHSLADGPVDTLASLAGRHFLRT